MQVVTLKPKATIGKVTSTIPAGSRAVNCQDNIFVITNIKLLSHYLSDGQQAVLRNVLNKY